MFINGRSISQQDSPYIIAEVSANHNGSIENAKACINAAKECGADAVKIQTYTANTMTLECKSTDFMINGGLWDGYSLHDLYKKAETPYEWHIDLFEHAKKVGITLFSTPFDETAVTLLESLGAPAFKIASFELTDLPLIARVAATGKPLLMSTGMASSDEIQEAVDCAKAHGCESLLLFHCTSSYPAPIDQANLKSITSLKEKFKCEVGLSDHSIGDVAPTVAVALGATAIEKHFTLDKSEKTPDSDFSIDPSGLQYLVRSARNAWLSLGSGELSSQACEKSSLQFRRSLYFKASLSKGDRIRREDIAIVRPGYALPPKYINQVVGKTVAVDVKYGERVTSDILDDTL